MPQDAEKLVEILGSCTEDLRDCEIMRTAIVLKDTEPDNEQAQTIRQQLAKSACEDCVMQYLADIK
jgi:hypothetical protein